jgi:hypothetical protein
MVSLMSCQQVHLEEALLRKNKTNANESLDDYAKTIRPENSEAKNLAAAQNSKSQVKLQREQL